METEKKKKKRKGFGPVAMIVLIAAVGLLTFSVCQLVFIQNNYSGAREEYDRLAESYVETIPESSESDASAADGSSSSSSKEKEKKVVLIRDESAGSGGSEEEAGSVAAIPQTFSVNWAGLKAVNPEIVGWIHVDGLPQIHYPICKGADNSYYLTHTFRRESYPSGSLFMDKNNAGDFSNALTFVYGHRMDDHSMFGDLRALESQALVDANPYFWIYTPEGVFCYKIFSVFEEPAQSDVFAYHFENDKSFLKWAENIRARSVVNTHTDVSMRDKVVALSTCTTDRVRRCLVFGKCISVDQPGPDEETPVPADEKAAARERAETEVSEPEGSSAAEELREPTRSSEPAEPETVSSEASRRSDWELSRSSETESFTEY